MGQYHYTVNLDKKEFLHPHLLGDGLKLLEQCSWCPGGVNDALHLLLACSSGRGGGDFSSNFDPKHEWIGRWAGDRIAVVGDYAEDADLLLKDHAKKIYKWCTEGAFKNITLELRPVLAKVYNVAYGEGEGWVTRKEA